MWTFYCIFILHFAVKKGLARSFNTKSFFLDKHYPLVNKQIIVHFLKLQCPVLFTNERKYHNMSSCCLKKQFQTITESLFLKLGVICDHNGNSHKQCPLIILILFFSCRHYMTPNLLRLIEPHPNCYRWTKAQLIVLFSRSLTSLDFFCLIGLNIVQIIPEKNTMMVLLFFLIAPTAHKIKVYLYIYFDFQRFRKELRIILITTVFTVLSEAGDYATKCVL